MQLEYADHWADKRHSQYWADRVHDETYRTNAELQAGAEEEHLRSSPHSSHHFKTANLADEYDGMLLQTDYADHWQDKRHSAYWKDRVNTEAKRLNGEWQETFAQANAATSPHNVHSYGATVDFGDEYNGMLVQTGAEYADHWTPAYKHHTQYWNDRVKDASIGENAEIRESLATMDHNANTHNTHHFGSTVDFADEYNGMLLQTDSQYADHWADKRHSQYWRDRVHDQALRTNQELLEAFSREDAAASSHNPDHFKTSDLTEEYNGMLVQEGDSFYSPNQDPYRDVRMKALRQQPATEPHYAPETSVWNSFTGETNGKAAPTAPVSSLAQGKFADNWAGDHRHSQLWEDNVKTETRRLAKQLDYVNEREARKDSAAFPDYYAASHEKEAEQMYDGMLVQDDTAPYSRHSAFYYRHENEVADELVQADARAAADAEERAKSTAADPVDAAGNALSEKRHVNSSLDYEEVWGGSVLVQLADHDNDDEDIVPELSEQDHEATAQLIDTGALENKKDFAGESYDVVYDA